MTNLLSFPMFLPADAFGLRAIVVMLETGALTLFISLMIGSRLTVLGAVLALGGLVTFFRQFHWMSRHRQRAFKELPRPDYGMGHALTALGFLAMAAMIGLVIIVTPAAEWKVDRTIICGVFALVGFLSQIVVGMAARLLPLFAWMHAYAASEYLACEYQRSVCSDFLHPGLEQSCGIIAPKLAVKLDSIPRRFRVDRETERFPNA